MKESFSFFGFKINTKKFILGAIAILALFALLLVVDQLWFDISWYGLCIGAGFIVAVVVASNLASERGLYSDFSYDIIWFVFPLAIIGSRVFYVMSSPHEFATFADTLKIWEGGLSIYGGIIGGTLGVLIFAKIKKLNPVKIMDVAAPVLALAQSIGRWGNFANQEVYGFEITNKAFQWFPLGVRITEGAKETWHLATFFYESVLNLIAFFVLTTILRKTKKPGIVTFAYLLWYGVIRMILESLRVEKYVLYIPGTNIRFSFALSVMFAVIGLVGMIYLYVREKRSKGNS